MPDEASAALPIDEYNEENKRAPFTAYNGIKAEKKGQRRMAPPFTVESLPATPVMLATASKLRRLHDQ